MRRFSFCVALSVLILPGIFFGFQSTNAVSFSGEGAYCFQGCSQGEVCQKYPASSQADIDFIKEELECSDVTKGECPSPCPPVGGASRVAEGQTCRADTSDPSGYNWRSRSSPSGR